MVYKFPKPNTARKGGTVAGAKGTTKPTETAKTGTKESQMRAAGASEQEVAAYHKTKRAARPNTGGVGRRTEAQNAAARRTASRSDNDSFAAIRRRLRGG